MTLPTSTRFIAVLIQRCWSSSCTLKSSLPVGHLPGGLIVSEWCVMRPEQRLDFAFLKARQDGTSHCVSGSIV